MGERRERWGMLAVICLAMLAFAVTFMSISPILPLIMADLQLSHSQAGLLMSLFALPGIFIAIPVGTLGDKYGVRWVTIVALVLMVIGVGLTMGSSYGVVAAGRTIAGMGSMTLIVLLPQATAQWFQGKEMGTAMGIFNCFMPTGIILSFNLLARLGNALGWRAALWPVIFVILAALVAFFWRYHSPGKEEPPRQSRPGPSPGLKYNMSWVWLAAMTWMWFNATIISFASFATDFFTGKGYGFSYANFLTSLAMWGSLLLSAIVGYVTGRFRMKELAIGIGGLGMAVSVILTYYLPSGALPLMLLLAFANALVPAPMFALIPELVPPQKLGFAYGILSIYLNIGVVVGPYVIGLGRDLTGSYQASFAAMSLFALLATVTMVVFVVLRYRRRYRQQVAI